MHSGSYQVTDEELGQLRSIVKRAILRVLLHRTIRQFRTAEELASWFEERVLPVEYSSKLSVQADVALPFHAGSIIISMGLVNGLPATRGGRAADPRARPTDRKVGKGSRHE